MKDEEEVLCNRAQRGLCLCSENTVPSFDKALDLGVDGLETDIRRTRDGVWFSFMTISWIISLILQAESRIIHMQNLKRRISEDGFPRNTKEQEFCGWMSFCAATAAGST